MRIAIYVLIGLCCLLVVAAYACCVIASGADERAEEMYRKWKESKDE